MNKLLKYLLLLDNKMEQLRLWFLVKKAKRIALKKSKEHGVTYYVIRDLKGDYRVANRKEIAILVHDKKADRRLNNNLFRNKIAIAVVNAGK